MIPCRKCLVAPMCKDECIKYMKYKERKQFLKTIFTVENFIILILLICNCSIMYLIGKHVKLGGGF